MALFSSGYIAIHVSQDEMKAAADFYPPEEGGEPLSLEQVKNELSAHNICIGVQWEAIESKICQCAETRRMMHDVEVARGESPVNQVPAHYVLEERLLLKPYSVDPEALKVDYHLWCPFVVVKEGDILARIVPVREGKEGLTVTGEKVPFGVERTADIQPGENTRIDNQTIISSCEGRFVNENNTVSVHEVLDISGNIDYSTGNIDFPGDVVIHGTIEDGFTVHAKGALFCEQTLNVSSVVGGGDLTTKNGIIGRKDALLQIHGTVRTKFIENCLIEAEDGLEVQKAIINSTIFTHGLIAMSRSGKIIGGSLTAQNGVSATQIGNEIGTDTVIACGVDFKIRGELNKVNAELQEVERELKNVVDRRKQAHVSTASQHREEELREQMGNLEQRAKELVLKLFPNEKAVVEVDGAIYPESHISICNAHMDVTEKMERVKFTLNAENRAIEIVKA